jgi:predicted transcriptional regulator of viral defense system
MNPTPRSPHSRLVTLLGAAGDVITLEDASATLAVSRTEAAKLLSRWTAQGWLRRVGPGTYVPVQLALRGSERVVQDPWTLVPAIFDPCYIGGRTAAEHWDLTEQVFRDIQVYTCRPVRRRTVENREAVFTVRHIKAEHHFGTKVVWRNQTRVQVSDLQRTIVDLLDDPTAGGGIRQVADCLARYLDRADADPQVLIAYADKLGNGAVFKRLGFLAEYHRNGAALRDAARQRLTAGHAKLDPGLDCARLVTRWRLRVPDGWNELLTPRREASPAPPP